MLKIAIEAAVAGGTTAASMRGRAVKHFSKEHLGNVGDFCTEADLESEKAVLEILQKNFPDHDITSEEIGSTQKGSRYRWIIDPIDGTTPFTKGLPFFGVSIGLLENNQPLLGVMYFPKFGITDLSSSTIISAEKNKGAYIYTTTKAKVSKTDKLAKALVGYDLAHRNGRKEEIEQIVIPLIENIRYANFLGCSTLGLALVAAGNYDAYIHKAYTWDFAAGAIIVEEAGGRVTDYQGKPIDWTKEWIPLVATNGILHDRIIEKLNK